MEQPTFNHCLIPEMVFGNKYVFNLGAPHAGKMQPTDIEDIEPEVEQAVRQRGPRKYSLFRDDYGRKDELRTQQEAERIKRYISMHHMGGKQAELDSSTTSKMNKVVAMFWQHWRDKEWVSEEFEGAPFYRFLTEDCGLACPVDEKPFSRSIRQIIEAGRISEIYATVADVF